MIKKAHNIWFSCFLVIIFPFLNEPVSAIDNHTYYGEFFESLPWHSRATRPRAHAFYGVEHYKIIIMNRQLNFPRRT